MIMSKIVQILRQPIENLTEDLSFLFSSAAFKEHIVLYITEYLSLQISQTKFYD